MTDWTPRPTSFDWTPESRTEWMQDAACHGTDEEVFFGPNEGGAFDPIPAKRICASCPVRVVCLDYAINEGIRFGIWGGRTPGERKLIKAARKDQAA